MKTIDNQIDIKPIQLGKGLPACAKYNKTGKNHQMLNPYESFFLHNNNFFHWQALGEGLPCLLTKSQVYKKRQQHHGILQLSICFGTSYIRRLTRIFAR